MFQTLLYSFFSIYLSPAALYAIQSISTSKLIRRCGKLPSKFQLNVTFPVAYRNPLIVSKFCNCATNRFYPSSNHQNCLFETYSEMCQLLSCPILLLCIVIILMSQNCIFNLSAHQRSLQLFSRAFNASFAISELLHFMELGRNRSRRGEPFLEAESPVVWLLRLSINSVFLYSVPLFTSSY
jgi:hypothetical protein